MGRRWLFAIIFLILSVGISACRKEKDTDLYKQTGEQRTLTTHEKTEASDKNQNTAGNYNQNYLPNKNNHTDDTVNTFNEAADETTKTDDTDTAEGEKAAVETMKQKELKLSELIPGVASSDTIRNLLEKYPAGTILILSESEKKLLASMFYSEEISKDIKERMNGKSYGENCTVPYSDLRYIRVLYMGFDSQTHIGEMIVNRSIAEDVTEIFKELYEQEYPIERMVLVDEFDADDNISMAADNTSSFNYRTVEGTDRLSLHSYGMAIDINPQYNPYVHKLNGKIAVTPENGKEYQDRSLSCSYYIKAGDICYEAFHKRGFTWGGDWVNTKDYQHFQKARE